MKKIVYLFLLAALIGSCAVKRDRTAIRHLNIYVESLKIGDSTWKIDSLIRLSFVDESPIIVFHDSIAVKFFHAWDSKSERSLFNYDVFWNVTGCWKRWFFTGYISVWTEQQNRNKRLMGLRDFSVNSPTTEGQMVKLTWSVTRPL